MKPTIVIIGAGSVVFTRELLGDIFSFPELAAVRVVLHDIDAERLETAEAITHATARAARRTPRSSRPSTDAAHWTAPTTSSM